MMTTETDTPFLPPSTPAVPYMTPVPTPIVLTPQAPKPKRHRARYVLLIGLALIVLVGIIAALVSDSGREGLNDGLGNGAVAVDAADVVTTTPGFTEDAPSWVTDPAMLTFSYLISDLLEDSTDLSQDMATAMETYDIDEAVDLARENAKLWNDAPDVPEGAPFTDEYDALRESAYETFTEIASALVTMDVDALEASTDRMMNETLPLTETFTAAVEDATAVVESYQD